MFSLTTISISIITGLKYYPGVNQWRLACSNDLASLQWSSRVCLNVQGETVLDRMILLCCFMDSGKDLSGVVAGISIKHLFHI